MIPFLSRGYRLGLALYGAGAFMMTTTLSTYYDPIVYGILGNNASKWKQQPPFYPWGFKVLWLALPIFLFIRFAPQISNAFKTLGPKNSQGFAIFEFLGFAIISFLSFIDFGLNASLAIQFVGYPFIVAATDYLRGFSLDFSFASNTNILREARIEKLKLLHKKWFSGISVLVTVAVAICVTSVLRLYDAWRTDFSVAAAQPMIQSLMIVIVYAGAGLVLGPFAHLLSFLGKIEDQFEKIEPPVMPSAHLLAASARTLEKGRRMKKNA